MTRQEQKLRAVILYLAQNVKNIGVIKLFKLLWFLDERHFAATGTTVTGIDDYMALPKGPVPSSLYAQIHSGELPCFLEEAITIAAHPKAGQEIGPGKVMSRNAKIITAKVAPDLSIFSPREERTLIDVVDSLGHFSADKLSEISHQEGDLWHIYRNDRELSGKKMNMALLVNLGKVEFDQEDWVEHQFDEYIEKKLAGV